jgi:hypothetical protein
VGQLTRSVQKRPDMYVWLDDDTKMDTAAYLYSKDHFSSLVRRGIMTRPAHHALRSLADMPPEILGADRLRTALSRHCQYSTFVVSRADKIDEHKKR